MGVAFVFEVVLLMIIGSFGVIGNFSLIKMFAQLEEKLNFHQLMITLAIFDSAFILLCMIVFAIPEILPQEYKTEGYHFYIAPKALALLQVAQTGSVYCTISISLERYLTVCHPFYFSGKNWSARRYIIPIVLFSVLYNMPRFFELRTKYIESDEDVSFNVTKSNETFYSHGQENHLYNETNLSYLFPSNSTQQDNKYTTEYISTTTDNIQNNRGYNYGFELTSMRQNKYYVSIYIIGLNFIVHGLIPFPVIITLNALLYRELVEIITTSPSLFNSQSSSIASPQCDLSSSLTSFQNETRRTPGRRRLVGRIKLSGIMLAKVSIAIVVVFVICHSVRWIPNTYELLERVRQDTEDESMPWPLWVEYTTEISHFLTVLNSSVNFYIYYITHYGIPTSLSSLSRNSKKHFLFCH